MKRSWLWTVALGVMALLAIVASVRAPRRVAVPAPPSSIPEPQLASGAGCASDELPRGLDAFSPQSEMGEEERERELARRRVVACLAKRLYPEWQVVFGYTSKNVAAYDLVAAGKSSVRLSASTYAVYPSTAGGEVQYLALIWPTREGLVQMPPVVSARADANGNISYFRALELDRQGRLSNEDLPSWGKAHEADVELEYSAVYLRENSESIVRWNVLIDTATPDIVKRVPISAKAMRGGSLIFEGPIHTGSIIGSALEVNFGDRSTRVQCTTAAGENCVLDPEALLDELLR